MSLTENGSKMDNSYDYQFKANFVKKPDFHLKGFCPDDDCSWENDEYKQVFSSAESYLNRGGPIQGDRSPYHNLKDFRTIVQRNQEANIQTTWGKLASAFFLLHWYALRILRAPWRKSYTKVKAYSGSYHHVIGQNLPADKAEELMSKMGFIYMRQRQTFFFNQETLNSPGPGTWKDALTTVAMDYFLIHVRCSLGSTEMGRSMEIDLQLLPTTPTKSTSILPERESRISRLENQRQYTGAFQPIGQKKSTQINSPAPTSAKRNYSNSSGPTRTAQSGYVEDRENRVERLPTYLAHSTKQQTVTPSEPYGHRISAQAKSELSRRIQKTPKYVSQTSDEDLYGSNSPDLSLQGICYPPREGPFAPSVFGQDTMHRVNQGMHVENSRQRSQISDRGYVKFMPIGAEKAHGSSRRDVPTPQISRPPVDSYLNMSSASHSENLQPSAGYSSSYVQFQPLKRGKPSVTRQDREGSSSSSHIYQEIPSGSFTSPGD